MQNFVCFKINGVKNENIKQNLEEEKEENILILLIKLSPSMIDSKLRPLDIILR